MYPEQKKVEISLTVNAPPGTTANIENLQAAETINNNTIIQPTPPASALPKIWNPPPENPSYFERAHTTKIKDHMTMPNEGARKLYLVAMSGLGGVGKTELAKNYFYHPEKNYTAKLWFSADSREHLESEYKLLAQHLKLIEKDDSVDLIKRKIHDFLAQHPGWLIIFDNADNPDAIRDLLPPQGGDILITSRNPNWQGQVINVDVLGPDEAVLFYKKLTDKTDEHIKPLVTALGFLPLAIAQAAAYVNQIKHVDTQKYLEYFNKYREYILKKNRLPFGTKAENDRLTIMTTWNLSIDALEKEFKDPNYNFFLTRELLVSCAYLASKNIPISLLANWTKKVYEEESIDLLLDEAIRQLSSHSLIQCDKNFIQIHRLVQDVIRFQNPLIQQRRVALSIALEAENQEDRTSMKDVKRRLELIPHLEAVILYWTEVLEKLKDAKQEHRECAVLLSSLLHFLGKLYLIQGSYHLAKLVLEKSVTIDEQIFGPTYSGLVTGLRNLGNAYINVDDAKNAVASLERALNIQKAVNEKDVQLADILGELGHAYALLDQLEKGRDLLQQAVTILEAHYGPTHIRLAITLRNLGRVTDKFDSKLAHKLLERALAIQEAYNENDHFEILPTLFGLTDTGVHASNSKEYAQLVRRAYAIAKSHYGVAHPETALVAAKLATSCAHLQDWVEPRDLLLRESYFNVCHFPGHGKDHLYAGIIVRVASECYLICARSQLSTTQNKKAALDILLEGVAWLPNNQAYICKAIEFLEKNQAHAEIILLLQAALATAKDKFLLYILLSKAYVELKNDALALKAVYQAWQTDETSMPILIDQFKLVAITVSQDNSLYSIYINCFKSYLALLNRISVNLMVQLLKDTPVIQQDRLLVKIHSDWIKTNRKKDFMEFIGQFPEHLELLNRIAANFIQDGNANDAAYYYEQFLEKALEADKPTAYHNLACCYYVLGKIDLADTYFKKAIATKPNSSIYTEYGHSLYQRGNITQAIVQLQKALALVADQGALEYTKMDKNVVNTTLRQAIEQWGSVTVSTQYFVCYLLVKCYQANLESPAFIKKYTDILKSGLSTATPIYALLLADINKDAQPSNTQAAATEKWNDTIAPNPVAPQATSNLKDLRK